METNDNKTKLSEIEFAEEFNGRKTFRTFLGGLPDYAMRWFFSTAIGTSSIDDKWHPFNMDAFMRFITTSNTINEYMIAQELQEEVSEITDEIKRQCNWLAKEVAKLILKIDKHHTSKMSKIVWRRQHLSKVRTESQTRVGDFMLRLVEFRKDVYDPGYGDMDRSAHNMETCLHLSMVIYDFPWGNRTTMIDLRPEVLHYTGWQKLTYSRMALLNERLRNMKTKKLKLNIEYIENQGWKWRGGLTELGKKQVLEFLITEGVIQS